MNLLKELQELAKVEITDFGKKPIEDVGAIMNIVQASSAPEKEVMPLTQEIYIELFQASGRGDLRQARQSWVVASGNNFETFLRNLINEELNKEGIIAVKGDQLRNKEKARDVVSFLTLEARRRCTQTLTGVWPDSDVVVLTKENGGRFKAFALLSCKTSDHSRNDAVLFWALALRNTGIKYALVTQDLDKRYVKGDDNASGIRKKSEAYLDRIFTTNPLTEECSQVKKIIFTEEDGSIPLFNDLRNWREEVVPNNIKEKLRPEDILN